jgi:hypothetical protein
MEEIELLHFNSTLLIPFGFFLSVLHILVLFYSALPTTHGGLLSMYVDNQFIHTHIMDYNLLFSSELHPSGHILSLLGITGMLHVKVISRNRAANEIFK